MNVWFVRSKTKQTGVGNSLSLKDEFRFYALPDWTFYFVGGIKIYQLCSYLSIWIDEVPQEIFAVILSVFMIFAILMHLKVV